MLFSSLSFIFVFLPVFLLCYYIAPAVGRRWILLLGSLLFYAVGQPFYVLLLMASVMVNYGFSLALCTQGEEAAGVKVKAVFVLMLLTNLSVLFLFKYWDFFAGILNDILGKKTVPALEWALPLGISFYTFQILSYQIDCFTKKKKRPAGFLDFALFVCMFPHLTAGPIMRYRHIEKELKTCGGSLNRLESGIKKFVIGLGLKVLLADQLNTLYYGIGTLGVDSLSMPLAWLGAISFSMQIYFDFWGYSVMAIGLGEMLGITIPENFRQPYWSKSISEFWRRWHITLGEWFKDYVYIPLGGSRRGSLRTCQNLLVVWALTGLWHGAAWNFVVWGLTFFALIFLEKLGLGKRLEKTVVLGHIYVLCVLPVTWVIFSATDMHELIKYVGCMFGVGAVTGATQMNQLLRFLWQYAAFLSAGVLCITPLPLWLYRKQADKWYTRMILLVVFWLSVYELYIGKNNPFLYFSF